MARIRSVKPEFFLSERVASVSIPARLFFIGLFCHIDRDGRAEWSPRRMKAQIFPYDDADTHALMVELVDAGLVRVYRVGDGWVCDLPGFAEHQRPHPKEAASVLPPCPNDWRDQIEPWKETASREKPGSIPASYAGNGSRKEILDQGREGASGSWSGSHARRSGYADPHGMRLDPTAAAHVVVGPEQLVAIPGHWWTKARREYRLTDADLDAFVAWLKGYTQRHGFEDGGKRLPYLDARLADFRAERANPNDGLRPASEWIAERMKRDAEIPEISAERRRELLRPVRAVKA